MAYIDIKHTVWQRYTIEDSDLQEFMKLDEKEKQKQVFHKLVDNASDIDWLFDTSEYISLADNLNNATLEIFDEKNSMVWDNRSIDVKREKKIEKFLHEK